MSSARLKARAPSARSIGIGRLVGHALRWHKRGRDGSGKCDVMRTGDSADAVWGVLFELDWQDKAKLDEVEGLGIGYSEVEVPILVASPRVDSASRLPAPGARASRPADRSAAEHTALTYQARPAATDPSLLPRRWYKDHVVQGAREHGLPGTYVAALERAEVEA